jgi:hypothetical protein
MFKQKACVQSDINFLVDDGIIRLAKGEFFDEEFWRIVAKYVKRAMVIVVNQVKSNITMMNAVATGFMRAHIVSTVRVDMGSRTPIVARVGTQAWYDILIHEGLGRHSPSKKIPEKYKPTPAQTAIVPPSDKAYWKPSPMVPRPFLKNAISQTRTAVAALFAEGFKQAAAKTGIKRGKPRHRLEHVLFSGGRL